LISLGMFAESLCRPAMRRRIAVERDLVWQLALALTVTSVNDTIEKLRSRGVTIVTEPFELAAISRRLAFFSDPFDNLIELSEVLA
jgi:predicted enzyme related to lactoylglutathione lyase